MIRLLKIELHKIIYNRTFWIILGLYLVLFIPTAYGLEGIVKSIKFNGANITSGLSLFQYPSVWFNMAYLAGWFKLILAVIIIILVTNEYAYRTLKQNVIDGMSKWEVIWAKELVIILLSTIATAFLAAVTIALGDSTESTSFNDGAHVLIAYFIALIIYLNFAYFLGTYLKKSGFSIGLLILYSIIIENIISWKLPDEISGLLPMNTIDKLIPNPFAKLAGNEVLVDLSPLVILMSLIYVTLFLVLIRWKYKTISN